MPNRLRISHEASYHCNVIWGGEGVGVGARQAGYTHLWSIERDPRIARVASLNGFYVFVDDVYTSCYTHRRKPDVLWASPPCQSFSAAKEDKGETTGDVAMATQEQGTEWGTKHPLVGRWLATAYRGLEKGKYAIARLNWDVRPVWCITDYECKVVDVYTTFWGEEGAEGALKRWNKSATLACHAKWRARVAKEPKAEKLTREKYEDWSLHQEDYRDVPYREYSQDYDGVGI